jgi:hypothetical protein
MFHNTGLTSRLSLRENRRFSWQSSQIKSIFAMQELQKSTRLLRLRLAMTSPILWNIAIKNAGDARVFFICDKNFTIAYRGMSSLSL